MIAGPKRRDPCADFLNNARPLVAKNSTWTARRDIALQDVQIGAAYRRLADLDDRIARIFHLRHWPIFDDFLAGSFVDKGFHIILALMPTDTFRYR